MAFALPVPLRLKPLLLQWFCRSVYQLLVNGAANVGTGREGTDLY
jgi:hypothetical protein